ncbi:MAG: terminase family protein [Cyanobacteria bacterium SBLK]|nr:terminase family protein [Cyanobacteria bacterium SBLK]
MFAAIPLNRVERESPQTYFYYRAGVGSGKSTAGAAFIVSRALLDPESRSLISANSYSQLATSTLVALAEFCERYSIPLFPCVAGDPNETARAIAGRRYCKIGKDKAHVLVLSAENFTSHTSKSRELGRGFEIKYFWGDEFAYADRSAIQAIQGRLRQRVGRGKPTGLITSTINRNDPYNWTYKLFDDPDRSGAAKRLYLSFKGSTRENAHNLSDGYYEGLELAYSPELAAIELEAEYANITEGVIFKYFSRDAHCANFQIRHNEQTYLSFDFNRSPACALACQFPQGELIVLKEWYMEDSDTFELSETVGAWLQENRITSVKIHGDATGNSGTANSTTTNWKIVKNKMRKHGIDFCTLYGSGNPSVQDSINSLNSAIFLNKIYTDKQCRELILDLERLKWKGRDIDKSDAARSHLADCLRYIAHYLLPLPREGAENEKRVHEGPIG